MAKHGDEISPLIALVRGQDVGPTTGLPDMRRKQVMQVDDTKFFVDPKKRRKKRQKDWSKPPPKPKPEDLFLSVVDKAHVGPEIPLTSKDELRAFAAGGDVRTMIPFAALPPGARKIAAEYHEGRPLSGFDTQKLSPEEREFLRPFVGAFVK